MKTTDFVHRLFILLLFLPTVGCSEYASEQYQRASIPAPLAQAVSFEDDVQPILEQKCLVCHGCYDAPCQLKLESANGLIRGAISNPVYDGTRLEAMAPTRLGFDASTEQQWRQKGFYSVLARGEESHSLFERMIRLGMDYQFPPNSKLPEDIALGLDRSNQCVSNEDFDDYAEDHPLEGMPLGVTDLSDEEYATLTAWLRQGASINPVRATTSADEQQLIERWEALLNGYDNRTRLVARWLYEHLFLAHLYFPELGDDTRYFEMVRSYTPPGEDISIVATPQPNDDPRAPFFYRLRPVLGSILHKRHITFPLGQAKLDRVNELFFSDDWPAPRVYGYNATERANPFLTFGAIPARSRYQFMLDNAEYFTRTFIRGPVCRGQIATDVIRDRFWTVFQDPDHDLYVTDADFRRKAMPLLSLPGQDSHLRDLGRNWLGYQDLRNRYNALRDDAYRNSNPDGASLSDVWDGDGNNDNALLTIFRHHDSASVQRGLIGPTPRTTWWLDYPLFERTYYGLVVNFDVFGNVAHQAQTRLYFDLIRNGAEHNFLRLLPADARQDMLDSWYQGSGQLKMNISYQEIDTASPTAVTFTGNDPWNELGQQLLQRYQPINAMAADPLNRCEGGRCARSDQPDWVVSADQALTTLAATPASELPSILTLPDVTFLRVYNSEGERTIYSLIRDRAHSNVAFMMGESLRYQPEHDRLTVYPGVIGSYPNFMFDVPADEVAAFSTRMRAARNEDDVTRIIETWGIRRTHPRFWEVLHDVTAWHRQHQPLQAGIFDINRYKNL